MVKIRVLELFSGIGGMHAATSLIQKCCGDVEFEIVAAVDINTTANAIYRFNHPDTTHWQRNITGISDKEINKLRPDMLLMSPPCQPHTRQGKRQDKQDPRSQALDHILQLIPSIPTLKYILLENVQGFDISEARDDYLQVLYENNFQISEFLINPTDIGIPNSRLRYYGLARRLPGDLAWAIPNELQTDFSLLQSSIDKIGDHIRRGKIDVFLQADKDLEDFLVDEKVLLKYHKILDIVRSDSDRSCCFTKAYGQYFEGTGSLLQQSGNLDEAYAKADLAAKLTAEDLAGKCQSDLIVQPLKSLRLRLFTGREIADLLGFPEEFQFPADTSRKQQYRTLGNSLNVSVVAILIHHLLS